jgi:hypothetical protein
MIEADMRRRTKRVARNVKLVVEFIVTRSRMQRIKEIYENNKIKKRMKGKETFWDCKMKR